MTRDQDVVQVYHNTKDANLVDLLHTEIPGGWSNAKRQAFVLVQYHVCVNDYELS